MPPQPRGPTVTDVTELARALPHLAGVWGLPWMDGAASRLIDFVAARRPWFEHVERDLAQLAPLVGTPRLRVCQPQLRDRRQIQPAIFEIHAAALLGTMADKLELHVPRPASRRNYDMRAVIGGTTVHADSKTRNDQFPFNLPPVAPGSWAGSRAGVDPRDLPHHVDPGRGDPRYRDIPESSEVKADLEGALGQPPREGCNLVFYGQIDGHRDGLEAALFGPERVGLYRDPITGQTEAEWSRWPFGAFSAGEHGILFRSLSGVVWVELRRFRGSLSRRYALYLNPHAANPLPTEVRTYLSSVIRDWTVVTSEGLGTMGEF